MKTAKKLRLPRRRGISQRLLASGEGLSPIVVDRIIAESNRKNYVSLSVLQITVYMHTYIHTCNA